MFLKPLATYLDRLKLSLRSNVCCVCRSENTLSSSNNTEFVCSTCQSDIKLRNTEPVMTWQKIPIYAACDFPLQLKQWLYQLKFNEKRDHALRLTEIMLHYWHQLPQSTAENTKTIIIPIPAHRGAQGTHHLSQIFQPFASELGVDYLQNVLQWTKPIHPQHSLYGRKLRQENVKDAFGVDLRHIESSLAHQENLRLILVDDLLTTGSTMMEALQTLRTSFPSAQLYGLTLCNLPMGLSR
jgi:predicted amidophosphoribosyltransferase